MQIWFSCFTWYFEQSIEGSLLAGLGTLEQYGSSLHFLSELESPLMQTWFSSEVTKVEHSPSAPDGAPEHK